MLQLKNFKKIPFWNYQTDWIRMYSEERGIFLKERQWKTWYQIYEYPRYASIWRWWLESMYKESKWEEINLEIMQKYATIWISYRDSKQEETTDKLSLFAKQEVAQVKEELSTLEKIKGFLLDIHADFRITTTEENQTTKKKIEIFL